MSQVFHSGFVVLVSMANENFPLDPNDSDNDPSKPPGFSSFLVTINRVLRPSVSDFIVGQRVAIVDESCEQNG